MASMTMTASFLGGATSTITKHQLAPAPAITRRVSIVAKASGEKAKEESGGGRRDLVFAAAAAAAISVAKVAMAEEPERGSPEAKKKYKVVCVTMPTARICRK